MLRKHKGSVQSFTEGEGGAATKWEACPAPCTVYVQ